MRTLDIYYDDLKPEVQKKVLELFKIKSSSEANLDVIPLFVLEEPEEE